MEPPIVRYTLAERVVHWIAALTFLHLTVTGLAFVFPALFWLTALSGGGYLARLTHPWTGLAFTLTVAWMAIRWRADMRMTNEDRAWRQALAQYIRNEDAQVPPAGKFNAGQKQFFYAASLAAFVLLASGVVLWRPDLVPPGLGVLRQAAVLVHSAAALVAIGALIVHVYMGVAVVPGSLHAIVRGEVSSTWAKAHHRLWHQKFSDAPRGQP